MEYDKHPTHTYTLQTLPNVEATYDAEDSHYFLSEWQKENTLFYKYDSFQTHSRPFKLSDQNEETSYLLAIVNNFCLFSAHVLLTHPQTGQIYPYLTNIPIGTFRYIMLEDQSFAPYSLYNRKRGFVVEGSHWSNGLLYQVRQDKEQDPLIYRVCLYINMRTKTSSNFPDYPQEDVTSNQTQNSQ